MKKVVYGNALYEKKLIAEAVERGVGKSDSVALLDQTKVGRSYPFKLDVPGVWVSGPDPQGRYKIVMSVAVIGLINIPTVIDNMRALIWDELMAKNLANLIERIDISVEDLMNAA
jgi:hypothetical protein